MKPTPIITWFEIPSLDFNRAVEFYERVFNTHLKREEMDGIAMAIFPHSEEQSAGGIVHGGAYKPANDGVCIYLYSTDFDAALVRVEQHGGKVVLPRMGIGCNGFIAHFIDSEGNRIGLHTME